MAYRIAYEWEKEKELNKPMQIPWQIILGMITVVIALAVRMMVPQAEQVLKELLHPLTDEFLLAAFGELSHQLEQGIPLEEAVFTFCREIIANGA